MSSTLVGESAASRRVVVDRRVAAAGATAVFLVLYGVGAGSAATIADARGISPWFPPAGIALALAIVVGRPAIGLIALADAVQLIVRDTGFTPQQAVALGLLQGVVWGGAGLALRRVMSRTQPLARVREAVAFLGVAGVASLVAALSGTAVLGTMIDISAPFVDSAARYFVGDAIGVVTITPALLCAWSAWRRDQRAGDSDAPSLLPGERVLMAVAVVAWPFATIALWHGGLLASAPLPLMWVALRLGMPAAAYAALAWSISAVWAFAVASTHIDPTRVQASLLASGVMTVGAGVLVTERERARARFAVIALTDAVTGLPRPEQFVKAVANALGAPTPRDVAVLTVHLRGIDPGAPHAVSLRQHDDVLRRIAQRMIRATSVDTTIARWGTDRFVALLEDADAQRPDEIAARLVSVLSRPLRVGQAEVPLDPAVGVARAHSNDSADDVIADADAAAHAAGVGPHAVVLFDDSMRRRDDNRQQMGTAIRDALRDGHFRIVFQPIVRVAPPLVVHGAEALLRWPSAAGHTGSPERFISVAESSGLMVPLGRWVLRAACECAAQWPVSADGPPPVVHVNVSPVQLADPRFMDQVREILDDVGLEPSRLCLEITESHVSGDIARLAERLRLLGEMGIEIALDDFGTGYSSLHRLQRLPVSHLKIDKSFVADVARKGLDAAIVSATLSLAKALGMHVVAEGVETPEQMDALRMLGCDTAQGYLISRPLEPGEMSAWLDNPQMDRPGAVVGVD